MTVKPRFQIIYGISGYTENDVQKTCMNRIRIISKTLKLVWLFEKCGVAKKQKTWVFMNRLIFYLQKLCFWWKLEVMQTFWWKLETCKLLIPINHGLGHSICAIFSSINQSIHSFQYHRDLFNLYTTKLKRKLRVEQEQQKEMQEEMEQQRAQEEQRQKHSAATANTPPHSPRARM